MQKLTDFRKEYEEKWGFKVKEKYTHESEPGISEKVIGEISEIKGEKGEHEWINKFRIRALQHFLKRPLPKWGGHVSNINFDDIVYYRKPSGEQAGSWEEVPPEIKETFDRLGIPEAERKFLSGVGAQFESENVYHKVKEDLAKQGVIFVDPNTGLMKYPHLFKKWFAKIVPAEDNKFAALNSAFFSGGSFIYVPPNVEVPMPLQAYFRINSEGFGQFERTLIIIDKGAKAHYIEGCLKGDEEVSVGDKLITIEQIKENDLVLNSEGRVTTVAKIQVRPFKGDLVEITPISAGNKFGLTPEHPVLCVKREKVITAKRKNRKLSDINPEKLLSTNPEFIPALELNEGDFLVYPINKEVKDHPEITNELLQLLGYYLAEGHTTKMNGYDAVVFSFWEHEKENIEQVKLLIKDITGKNAGAIHDKKKHGMNVYVYSKELASLCEKYCGRYAKNKMLHKDMMELLPSKQVFLTHTYMKGDGSIDLTKSILIRMTTISKQLAFQLQEIFARQGIYAAINVREAYSEKLKDGRKIHHNKKYTLHFRKAKKASGVWLKDKDYFLVTIRKINKMPFNGPVYNFEVSNEPNTYLVKGFAVHNCTAPVYSKDSLHAAVVEIVALPGSHFRYTTLQNWSNNVFNLVTKRAHAFEGATVEWVDANIGSKLTMKYPSVYMLGPNSRADILSVAFAGKGQHQDTGGKAIHYASNTTSRITSKSVSKDGGRTSYRGLLFVDKNADDVKSSIRCDALLLDEISKSDTYPYNEVNNETATITHEATVGKIGEEKLFYLMSRGLSENDALNLVVMGFFDAFTKEIPLEYAIEFNRLIQLEMSGAVG